MQRGTKNTGAAAATGARGALAARSSEGRGRAATLAAGGSIMSASIPKRLKHVARRLPFSWAHRCDSCAECKRALQANEPIWRVRIRRLGRNIHGLPRIKTSTESICAQCASERIDLPEYSSGPCATAVAWFTMRMGDSLADTDTVANIVN
jgi:hypothetical protein